MKLRTQLSHRDQLICAFLGGMLAMALLVLVFGSRGGESAARSADCSRSIAVANALHQFIEEQHGTMFYADGRPILRPEPTSSHSGKFGGF